MSPMVEIVKGPGHPDEGCLHCAMAQLYSEFSEQYPEYKRGTQVVGDVAHFLGEIIGSGIYNAGRRHQLEEIIAIATTETRRTALELLQTLDKQRTS